MSRRPVLEQPVRCGGCAARIEACNGLHADWMHTEGRRERCPAGGFARPQTVFEMTEWERAS